MSDETTIPYIWKSFVPKKQSDINTNFEILEVKIDDEVKELKDCFKKEISNEMLKAELNLTLEGKKKYDFLIKMRKVVPFDNNRIKSVNTKYFINNLDVTFTYPKSIKLEFIESGTIGNFKTIGETDVDLNSRQLIKRFNGLIFPKQGFVFFLIK